ncbi:MAG: hypothetical protein J6J43_06465 [Oscillospiraceae bacterium]|nr:hypothetical protein [Oscillospiraceae bacterium]
MKLEKEFQLQAMQNAQTAMLVHSCPTKRLLQTLETDGGVKTVQELCKRHRVSDGFDDLCRKGLGELTLEALVVKGKYGILFTDDEVNFCLDVLMQAGHF